MARVLIPWVGLLAAVFLFIFAVPRAVEGLIIASNASEYVSTRAEVKGRFEKEHKLGSTSVVEFTYRVDGRKYYGSNEVTVWADDEDTLDPLIRKDKDGKKSMLVYFDEANPRRVVVRKDVPRWPHIAWLAGTLLVCLWSLSSILGERRRKAMVERARQRHSRPSSSSASGSDSDEPAS